MFEQKFRKQFAQMFPLTEQEGEEQSVNPSLNKNSNEDQSCQDGDGRVTPHYKAIEQDQDKSDKKINNQNENSQFFEDNLQKTCSEGDNNYQRMRQNPNINCESFLIRKITFQSKEDQHLDQTKQMIVFAGGPGTKQQDYEFSPQNSSFQHLMDSNIKRIESMQEKKPQTISKPPIYIEDKRVCLQNQVYSEVTINQQPLSREMLLDPQIRWKLVIELLALQSGHDQLQSPGLVKVLEQMQQKHMKQKQEFIQERKTVEQRVNIVNSLLDQSLKRQVEQRQRKQFVALYKYQQAKNSIFQKFSEKAQKGIQSLTESIGKRFQKANLELMKAKRVLTHSIESHVKDLIEQEQKIEQQMIQLKKNHNQSLQDISNSIHSKFTKIEQAIVQVKRQLNIRKSTAEENLEKLSERVMGLLQKEIAQGNQIEQEMTKLLFTLIEKLE